MILNMMAEEQGEDAVVTLSYLPLTSSNGVAVRLETTASAA